MSLFVLFHVLAKFILRHNLIFFDYSDNDKREKIMLHLNHEEWKILITTWVILGLLVLIALIFRVRKSVYQPKGFQVMVESSISGLQNFVGEVLGEHRAKVFFPLILAFFFFILFSNVVGLFPFVVSPTSSLNTTVPLALLSFFTSIVYGLIKLKGHFFKRFLGPIIYIAPLMVIIELVGELSKPFSLSVRLFANIWGEELAHNVIFDLVPPIAPLIIKFLMSLTDVLQAFVFIILSMVYISLSSEEHE